jgi:hypothetical protein
MELPSEMRKQRTPTALLKTMGTLLHKPANRATHTSRCAITWEQGQEVAMNRSGHAQSETGVRAVNKRPCVYTLDHELFTSPVEPLFVVDEG